MFPLFMADQTGCTFSVHTSMDLAAFSKLILKQKFSIQGKTIGYKGLSFIVRQASGRIDLIFQINNKLLSNLRSTISHSR